MINQFICDVTKRPSFVHSADFRSAKQQRHWYRACRLNSRYVVGSGWYVRSGAVAWRHMDMRETWDPEQWLWTLTSGNSVDADLCGSEVTRGSTSFLSERARRRTRGGGGLWGNHKRGYWLREERGRLMMPEPTSGNNGGFLIIYISIQESISGTLVKREIECPVRHTSARVEVTEQSWQFDS